MKYRPKINIKHQRTDYILEVIALAGLVLIWIIVILNYSQLPEIMPSHLNTKGEVDGYANKIFLYILPVNTTLLYIGLTVINRYPHTFNYPVQINKNNAEAMYRLSKRLVLAVKTSIMIIFIFVQYNMIYLGLKGYENSNGWLILLFVVLLLGMPIIIYLSFVNKYKKQEIKK